MLSKTAFALMAALASFSAQATDYWVSPDGTGDYLSRTTPGRDFTWLTRKKLKAGDVVHLLEGTHRVYQTSETGLAPKLTVNATIVGETDDRSKVVIDANNANRGLIVDAGVSMAKIANLTIRNCKTDYQGAGICTTAAMGNNYTVTNCVIENCVAKYQGGGANGGIWYDSVIRNCRVTNKTRTGLRKDSTTAGAESGSGGGVWGGELHNCMIVSNQSFSAGAGLAGGLLANSTTKVPARAYNCTIAHNTTNVGPGGGVGGDTYVSCELYDCWIEHNLVTNIIDGVSTDGKGAGLAYCQATGCTITNCYANYAFGGMGGGVYKSDCTDCTIVHNYAAYHGGGAFMGSCSTCLIADNWTGYYYGGGTYNTRTRNCIVTSNASGRDGAAHSRGYHEGDIVFNNTAHTKRASDRTGYGAAICNSEGTDPCVAVNCTVYYNLSNLACPVVTHAVMTNTLIWGNSSAFASISKPMVNCFWKEGAGTAPDGSVGCKTHASDAGFVGGSGGTALLAAVQKSLRALALKPSSPCVDAGVNHPWMVGAKDVFGTDRICQEIVDIGALERFRSGFSLLVR